MPLALGPIGLAGMNARRGEVQAARAAENAGIPFCLSTVSACPISEIAGAIENPFWFQLYMIRDRGFLKEMLARITALGVETLVLTVDLIVHSARYRDVRSSLTGSQGMGARLRRFGQIVSHPGWAWDVGLRGGPHICREPVGVQAVHPDREFPVAVIARSDGLANSFAGSWFGVRSDGILKVEDERVGRDALRLFQRSLVGSRHVQHRPARAQLAAHGETSKP
jgi:isopentenyl diphosphate isomerase/L-lactate dehydrogenase-like FMN-dependent dehydrogenase